MYCRVQGCSGKTSRYGAYCTTHKARNRRHGDVCQETITAASLNPYRSAIQGRLRKNPNNSIWSLLQANWSDTIAPCEGFISDAEDGGGVRMYVMTACREVAKLARYVEPKLIIETALAMFLMQDQEPRKFKSDKAFRFQLSRRLRALTDVNVGTFINPTTGKPTRVYRELKPRAAEYLGQMACDTFGGAGVLLAELERKEVEGSRQRRVDMAEAIGGLV